MVSKRLMAQKLKTGLDLPIWPMQVRKLAAPQAESENMVSWSKESTASAHLKNHKR